MDNMAAHLRALLRAPEADQTAILRETAAAIVTLRAAFECPDGTPDWAGRSYAYRSAMTEAFELAGLQGEDRKRVQARLSHHVSVALHERVPAEELAAKGLRPIDTRGRSVEKRQSQAATMERLGRVFAHYEQAEIDEPGRCAPFDGERMLELFRAARSGDEARMAEMLRERP